ncbi:MAG TPA: PAS domain S-box protein [Microvirga sp.]|nr:PAS domain S-box protein [Microvirga sp.]
MRYSDSDRHAKERLRRALRGGRIVAWEWDLGTGGLAWTDNVHEVLGGAFDLQGAFERCIHADDQARHREALERTFAEGVPYDLEFRFRRPDGPVIWIQDKAEIQTDEDGRRTLSGITIDITARKEAEAAAQASADRWRGLFDSMHEGFFVGEAIRDEGGRMRDFRFVEVNPAFERLTGMPLADITGRTVRQVGPRIRERLVPVYERVLDTGEPVQFEVQVPNFGGRWYEVRARAAGPERFAVMFQEITARKRAEAEAREKNAVLEATLQNMDQGLVMLDADGLVQVFNRRAADLLDLPVSLLARRPSYQEVREIQFAKGEFARSDEAFRRWVAQCDLDDTRDAYERVRPDGSVLEVRTVRLPAGGQVRTYTDMTARRKAEAALRESEERFRTLTEAMPVLVFACTRDGENEYVNHGYQVFAGRSAEELLGDRWIELLHPDDRDRTLRIWEDAKRLGKPYELEYRLRRADGTYRSCLTRGVALKDANGGVERWLGVCIDIHDQKLAEAALRESEERYRTLAENTVDLVIRSDMEGVRLYVSPSSADLLGYRPDELAGSSTLAFVHPEDRPALTDKLVRLRMSQTADRDISTHRLQRADGTWIWVEATFRLVRDRDGAPKEVVTVIRDVSERRRLEERLRQSQKMEAVGQLTGGIAHDFNNLLTVILGNAEILADEIADPQFRPLAQMIQLAAEKGALLTQHLLAFGRRQTLKPQRLRLREVVLAVAPLLRRTIGETIEVATVTSRDSRLALVDRTLLESAILNLAVNAKDAMPQGGTLTITCGEAVAGPDQGALPIGQDVVFVTVSDTGRGMSPDVLSRVFEPFFTTKEVGKGSGLGLSMVYGFAQQSGGHVAIESRPGQGTAVTILLPAVTSVAAVVPVREPDRPTIPGRERVLLVEDEPQVLQFVSAQLVGLGYDVTAVSAGPDALDLLREDSRFDLLFTDVVLPRGMSGVELASQARQIRPGIKVLLTSGYPEEVFEHHGSPERGTLLLRKPYKRKDLAETLRKVLDPQGA